MVRNGVYRVRKMLSAIEGVEFSADRRGGAAVEPRDDGRLQVAQVLVFEPLQKGGVQVWQTFLFVAF